MVLETNMKLYMTDLDFLEKNILIQKLWKWKWTKNGPKTGFFEFIEIPCHQRRFFSDLFYTENLYYIIFPLGVMWEGGEV